MKVVLGEANLRPGKHALVIGLGAKRITAAFLIVLITPTQSAPEVGTGCTPACAVRGHFTIRLRIRRCLRLHLAVKITIAVHPAARAMNFGRLCSFECRQVDVEAHVTIQV